MNNSNNKTMYFVGIIVIIIVVAIFGYRKYKANYNNNHLTIISGDSVVTFDENANPYLEDTSFADVKLEYDKKTDNYVIKVKAKKKGITKLHITETDGNEKILLVEKKDNSIGFTSASDDELLEDEYQLKKKNYNK